MHDEETGSQAALKIVKSAEHYTAAARDEVEILTHIREKDRADSKHCCRMIDTFEHKGPHGRHVCMVFEVLGDNLLELIRHYDHDGIPLDIVKKLSKEILEGLEFLHDTCKVIHTDLKPENVMLRRPLKRSQEAKIVQAVHGYKKDPLAWKSQNSKLATLLASGKPLTKNQKKKLRKKMHKQQQERKHGKGGDGGGHEHGHEHEQKLHEEQQRRSIELSKHLGGLDVEDGVPVEKKLMGMECKIVDFGNACWVDKHFTEEIQTRQYRSPEVRGDAIDDVCVENLRAIRYLVASQCLVAWDIVSMAKSDTGGFATSGVRRDDDRITFFVPNMPSVGYFGIRV